MDGSTVCQRGHLHRFVAPLLSTYQSNFCCKKPSAMVSMLGSTLSGVLDRGGFAGGGLAG